MRNWLTVGLVALAVILSAVEPAKSQDVKAGDLVLKAPYSRATPKTARVGAGYIAIENAGAEADRLLAVECACAEFAQVHTMEMTGGVMQMRHLSDGLPIPAGATVKLEPGGRHLMFINLKAPFVAGETVAAMLTFERTGAVEVAFEVRPLREKRGHKHH